MLATTLSRPPQHRQSSISHGTKILDNITLSWLSNTGVSSAQLYVEYRGAFFNDHNISVPAAVSVFPDEVYQASRSWTERAYHNLIHFNALDKGGRLLSGSKMISTAAACVP